MKTFLIIGGAFIIIFICLIPLKRDIDEYHTQKNGERVEAIITYVPNCFGARLKHFIKFKFEGKIYSKAVGAPCDTYKMGDIIELKHTRGTDVFLYVSEKKETEFIANGFLAALGITFIVIGIRKGRKNNAS